VAQSGDATELETHLQRREVLRAPPHVRLPRARGPWRIAQRVQVVSTQLTASIVSRSANANAYGRNSTAATQLVCY
jgi:hypothetical protein